MIIINIINDDPTHEGIEKMNRMYLALFLLVFSFQSLASESLTIFSGRSDKFVKPVAEAFTQKTGIKVTIHAGKSAELLSKLKLEGNRTDADLFISNDAGSLQQGSELGLFSTLPDNITNIIPKNYRAPDDTWVGLSARARVIVVGSKSALADSINSVEQLADKSLEGKLGITSATNESFIAGVTVYQEKWGDTKTKDWLKGLKENAGKNVFNKHSHIVKAVAQGKLEIGLVNHYYIYRHLAEDPKAPIKIILPDQKPNQIGLAWNVAGIAVSKHSKNTKTINAFLDFCISEEGQKIFAEVNREYPTRAGVAASPEVPKAGSYKVADVPMASLGKKRNSTVDLIEAVGLR